MKGWLITNAFLHTHKFTEIHLWLTEAAKKLGVDLIIKTNAEVLVLLNSDSTNVEFNNIKERPDFILFWDKDVRLAKYLEIKGYHVFNSSQGIAACDDKSLTHLYLQSAGVKMPRTIVAPMTFSNIGYTKLDFLDRVEKELNYPIVIKECFGSFGQQVYLAGNRQELIDRVTDIGAKPMLFQEFVQSSKGKDLRLQVVGNQVVATMYRYSDNGDFRANITNGGKMKPYEPTQKQIELAIQCCKILGLDFAGVDILFGKNQEPIVCEVNSNAHFKNIYDCTGVNVADSILAYIIKRICIGNK
ncbi:RimK family alpha-L-glutamate ligase [Anaerocolumna sedimenticola]|uniref:RimK family alpha-L-glutamate ligase n=1 Tax=Anaerocolumna sedimenticola TaxID=2696063 RepID=A0A6P1TNY7_9FIRM|nr:RimK family alpha-L-glutamate ligase [Anaerocolumna sedimenticola]QHQ62163.1 RimK family alpha-L-glutamate ligase [Anaerocolumna sedimenticola]